MSYRFLAACGLLLLVGATAAQNDSTPAAFIASSEAHTNLTAALKTAGVYDSLNDTTLVATIFAPDDAAFADFLQQNADLYSSLDDFLRSVYLTPILQYHIVPGITIALADMQDGQKLNTTFALEQLMLSEPSGDYDNDLYEVNGAQTNAFITSADHSAGQATVHVVDSILLPSQESLEASVPEQEQL